MRLIHITLIILIPALGWCQLSDDFSDGNIVTDPQWLGDINAFSVTSTKELQLTSDSAGTSAIYVLVDIPDSAEWRFDFRLEFSPSFTNRVRIYLMSSSPDLMNGDAYFIEIGENGQDDGLQLYAQLSGKPALIGSGGKGLFGTNPAQASIRVTRKNNSYWTFYTDTDLGENWNPVLELQDDFLLPGDALFFGLMCFYSDSRKDKFFFDNISILEFMPDTTPPEIKDFQVLSAQSLFLEFNEALLPTNALNIENYSVDGGIGNPVNVILTDINQIRMDFSKPFISSASYTLNINHVADLAGNSLNNLIWEFTFIDAKQPHPYSILINEIMADPSPQVALPPVEFVELYNRSTFHLQLKDLVFETPAIAAGLPEHILEPGGFVIITSAENEGDFEEFGEVLPLAAFPNLPNSGTTLILRNLSGEVIHTATYELSTYKNTSKSGGGWSLELISPGFPCSGENNWAASTALPGGTPGIQNALFLGNIDLAGPKLKDVFPVSDSTLLLFFDEYIDQATGISLSQISIDPFIEISEVSFPRFHPDQITLHFSPFPLQPQTLYTITVDQVVDCAENLSIPQTHFFGLPEKIDSADLIINELLYEPEPGGARFVELYNRSDKFLNVNELVLAEILGDTVEIETVDQDYLFHPDSFIVLTSDPDDILARYRVLDPALILKTGIPSLNKDSGNISVFTINGTVDHFTYHHQLHSPLLDETRGVSLERIDPHVGANIPGNWHSASETAGYATPGYQNSHFNPISLGMKPFSVVNRTFSPDGDGERDLFLIHFSQVDPGYSVRAIIFDNKGRLIKEMSKGELVGGDSILKWDGTDKAGQLGRIGIYLVWIELTMHDGFVRKFKEVCVLAKRL